ncbi:MAG TPA: helix-hairpin-helix domain-containing protein [Bacteroidales bacterium]|nr:helix-hairpin-helix domain-containing protein [Bacteroidales bacterium]HPT12302.1 helix-hairpin-helix domain-containing protein [Bacteroidales bacterium]
MAERFTSDLLFILIVLIVAAGLGFLIGYLVRKSMKCKKCIELEEENEAHKYKIAKLEEEVAASKFKIEKLMAGEIEFDAAKAKAAMGKAIKLNDLEIVEGIGPKIAGILKSRGIATWEALAEATPDTILKYLIEDGGEQYRIHVPDTWPAQSRLAAQGKWEELKTLQDKLMGGKEV